MQRGEAGSIGVDLEHGPRACHASARISASLCRAIQDGAGEEESASWLRTIHAACEAVESAVTSAIRVQLVDRAVHIAAAAGRGAIEGVAGLHEAATRAPAVIAACKVV